MMLLHVCRTRVARSPWKTVSYPSSTSSVKGNLGGQAWLTQVPCLVRRGPEECNTTRSARRASKVNTGPLSCEASQPRCCDTPPRQMSLGGSWWWSEDMVWSQDVKIGTTQVALWKKVVKSSTHRMNRCVSLDDPMSVQRRVTNFSVKTQKSPDDPV